MPMEGHENSPGSYPEYLKGHEPEKVEKNLAGASTCFRGVV